MKTPDISTYDPNPVSIRRLIERTGLSQAEAARRIGVGERTMRAYLADRMSHTAVRAPYPVQFALEALAEALEAERNCPRCERCAHPVGSDWLDDGETCPRCKLVQ